MQNSFIHFYGRDLTQSGKYNLGPLDHHPINQEDKKQTKIPLFVAMLTVIFPIDF